MEKRHDSSDHSPTTLLLASPLLRWGPALLWMAGIFIFSSRPNPLGPLSHSKGSDVIGRAAHLVEYAGLAALLHWAVVGEEAGWRARWISLGGTLAYAVLDEIHQGLVPGRECSIADVGYDLVGALASLGLIWIRRRRKARSA